MKRLFFLALLVAAPAFAADDHGHDHGHDHGPAAPAAAASPRFEARSDLFELVGIADHGRLTLYLDRHATNEPVPAARIEWESGAQKGVAAPQPDGTYLLAMAGLDRPGHFPFSFTVTAGPDTDLLAGELDVADGGHGHAAGETPARRWWPAGAGLVAIALGIGIGIARVRRRVARKETP